jgi:hypothetical protein
MIQAFTASAVVNPDLADLASAALNPSILFLYASSTAFFVPGVSTGARVVVVVRLLQPMDEMAETAIVAMVENLIGI